MKKKNIKLIILIVLSLSVLGGRLLFSNIESDYISSDNNKAVQVVNDNIPTFTKKDKSTLSYPGYEYYSALDSLGRCGYAEACVGFETMPTNKRESISKVKPTGWMNNKYDFIEGGWLYNRCHLIAFCLTGENANDHNLITGTRFMNVEGMLPYEIKIQNYIEETDNHVMYRVEPDFKDDNMLASGVHMMAQSVEDNTISFNVYCPNIQPGVKINYSSGDNYDE